MVCTGQGSHVKQTIATINHVHASNWPPCPWPTDLSQISMPSTAQVHENSWNFGLGFVLLLLLSTHARTNARMHITGLAGAASGNARHGRTLAQSCLVQSS